MNELSKIDLNQAQVLQRTREALSQLIEGWDMGYDDEPRDEVRQAAMLLDLLFEQSPEGIAHAAKIAKEEEEMRLHNERIDAERQYAEDQDIEEAREAALKASDRDGIHLAKEAK